MARNFNGTSHLIGPPNIKIGAGGLTHSAWIFPANTTQTSYSTWNGDEFNGGSNSGGLGLSSGKPQWTSTTGGGAVSATSPTVVTANQWIHILGTNYSSNNTASDIEIWVNGAKAAGVSMGALAMQTGTNPFRIGCRFNNSDSSDLNFYSGAIGEVAIWNSGKFTPMEILLLAAGLCPLLIRPWALLGYWPLYGTASPEPDWSGNNNWGTLGSKNLSGVGPTYFDHPPQVQYPRSFLGPIEDQVWSTLIGSTGSGGGSTVNLSGLIYSGIGWRASVAGTLPISAALLTKSPAQGAPIGAAPLSGVVITNSRGKSAPSGAAPLAAAATAKSIAKAATTGSAKLGATASSKSTARVAPQGTVSLTAAMRSMSRARASTTGQVQIAVAAMAASMSRMSGAVVGLLRLSGSASSKSRGQGAPQGKLTMAAIAKSMSRAYASTTGQVQIFVAGTLSSIARGYGKITGTVTLLAITRAQVSGQPTPNPFVHLVVTALAQAKLHATSTTQTFLQVGARVAAISHGSGEAVGALILVAAATAKSNAMTTASGVVKLAAIVSARTVVSPTLQAIASLAAVLFVKAAAAGVVAANAFLSAAATVKTSAVGRAAGILLLTAAVTVKSAGTVAFAGVGQLIIDLGRVVLDKRRTIATDSRQTVMRALSRTRNYLTRE